MTYPDHHQGIVGHDRPGDMLLSFDEKAAVHRDAIAGLTIQLFQVLAFGGEKTPFTADLADRMETPAVGDFVVEVAIARGNVSWDQRRKATGLLIAVRTEWNEPEWEWQLDQEHGATDDDRGTVKAWYVQYGPDAGDVCRWTDCKFLPALTDHTEFDPFSSARRLRTPIAR